MSPPTGADDPPPAGTAADPLALSSPRGRWVVAATVLGSGMAMLDSTVVGIALPSIGREFHGGVGTLQWVVTGYALTLAAFLLLGGSLGDRYGRKRVFSVGVVWFAVASALLRPRPGRGAARRRPGAPGGRRGVAGAGEPGHHPGVVPRRRPGPRHRGLVRAERRGRRRRPADRRLPDRRRLVALGLLHQPPRRRRRALRHRPPRARIARPVGNGAHRRRRRRARRRLPGRSDLRADRGPDPRLVEPRRGSQPRRRRAHRRRPSSSSSTARPTRCSPSGCSAPGSSAGPTP